MKFVLRQALMEGLVHALYPASYPRRPDSNNYFDCTIRALRPLTGHRPAIRLIVMGDIYGPIDHPR